MTVLVCDDDPSARFVIKRLLTQQLGCTVAECGDGVEALSRLDRGDIDLVVLDIQMPQLDGVEVLEAIRTRPALKGLPVIMVSSERREEIVLRLVRLGIDGYVLKPLRAEKMTAAIDPLRARLRSREGRTRPDASTPLAFGPDSPAMLVEGNPDYRRFFVSQASTIGPMVEAVSGTAALASFRQSPVRVVFVGADVGVLRGELLAQKLRTMAGDQPLRLVAVVDAVDTSMQGFDDVMMRSLLPDAFHAELRRFTQVPGPVAAVTALFGDLGETLTSAARQVFGMMLDAELEAAAPAVPAGPLVRTAADIVIHGRHLMVFGFWATSAALAELSARMLGIPVQNVTDEDRLSTGCELTKLLTGRLHAVLDEHHVPSECSLPRTEIDAGSQVPGDIENRGVHRCLTVPGTAVEVQLTVEIAEVGVDDGTRTRSLRSHSPAL